MPKRSGNPQLEDGHTRIANELLEALLAYPFHGGELKVLLAIIRLTYGWQTTSRPIKQRQLARLTGFDVRHIQRLLASLRRQGVLFRNRQSHPHSYCLNKRYPGWQQHPTGMSGLPDNDVASAPDTCVRAVKERKEKRLKDRIADPAVHNFLASFSQLLNRPLHDEEQALVLQLYELSPIQAQQLLAQAVCAAHSASPTIGGHMTPPLRERSELSGRAECDPTPSVVVDSDLIARAVTPT